MWSSLWFVTTMVLTLFFRPRSSMAFLTRPTIRWRHQKLQPQLDGGRPYRIPTTGSTRHFSVPPQTPDSLDSISDSWSLDDDVEEGDDWNDNDDDYRQNIIRQGENRADYKWFQNMTSLPFACTGCGKCCKTEGHVYMAPEEHDEASKLLGISKDEFIQHYASHVIVSEEMTRRRIPQCCGYDSWINPQ